MPFLRDNQNQASISKMNGNHEATNDAHSFISNASCLTRYQEALDGFNADR